MINLSDISKVFKIETQKVIALKKLNLSIEKESMIAITGRSGAGKSTLLHIIGTLDKATSGKLEINRCPIYKLADKQISHFRNQTIGFVFQMNNLLNEFSAMENIMMPGLIAGQTTRQSQERAYEVLNAVKLGHRAKHRPGELSGGEQQRIAIARALFMAPPVLLADEPTGNLDNKTSGFIQDLLFDLCHTHKMTMLLVTHDTELAKRFPMQIVMDDGQIITRGSH